jgi:cytochrome P450
LRTRQDASVRHLGFDLTDLDNYRAGFPHDVFTRQRAEAPVYWHAPTPHTLQGEGFWVVSRHADALAIQLDAKRFSSVTGGARERGGTMIADPYGAGLMLNMMDDPRRRRIRGLVNKGLTPHRIGALEPELRRRPRDPRRGARDRRLRLRHRGGARAAAPGHLPAARRAAAGPRPAL